MIFLVQNEPETKHLACLGYYGNKIQQYEQMYTDCLIHVGVMTSPSSHRDGTPLNELSWYPGQWTTE